MDLLAVVGRIALALVFVVAGIAKAADPRGTRDALEGFGLPTALIPLLRVALPAAELAVAALLLVPATVTYGAIGALVLLAGFVIAIGVNLARGRRPDCHCFGQLHSKPAGGTTIARNVALMGIAGVVLWRGDAADYGDLGSVTDTVTSDDFLAAALLLLALAALAQGFFIYGLLRQNGRILLRLDAMESGFVGKEASEDESAARGAGLPVGSPAPDFSLPGLHGETMTLAALRSAGKPVLLTFTDPGCGPCNQLMPDLGRWQREHADKLTMALISRKTVEDNRAKAAEHGLANVLLQEDFEIAEAYRFQGTPSAVIVEPDGTIGSPLMAGPANVQHLVNQRFQPQAVPAPTGGNGAGGSAPAPPGELEIGTPAPDFRLRDLRGKEASVRDLRGQDTVLLFWNPGCGFCQQMLDDLRAWEAERTDGPRVVVVSRGTVAENAAMGLTSRILLDEDFTVAPSFGANGTPMAVLLDRNGTVASHLAVGGPAVMELARQGSSSSA